MPADQCVRLQDAQPVAASPARNGTTKSTEVGQIVEGVDDVARSVEGRRSDVGEQRSQPAGRHAPETWRRPEPEER